MREARVRGLSEIDLDGSSGIVERVDTHAEAVLPLPVALLHVPALQQVQHVAWLFEHPGDACKRADERILFDELSLLAGGHACGHRDRARRGGVADFGESAGTARVG